MKSLQTFISRISGTYTNETQKSAARIPKAIHITTPCNERIKNLSDNFHGIFVIDETYYDYGDNRVELHHLYCYKEEDNGDIQLVSYCIPNEIKEQDLRHDIYHPIDFTKLYPKQKLAPIIFTQNNDIYSCEGWNEIAPQLNLHVVMKIYHDHYTVVEASYQEDTFVSGFEDPICYRKI